MSKFLVLPMLFLVACAVEPAANTEATTEAAASALTEVAPTTSTDTKVSTVVRAASCFDEWDCRICGTGRTQNILVQVCDDGSETIIQTRPCGEDCF